MSALSMRTTFALGKNVPLEKKIQFLLALSRIRTPKFQEPSLCYLAEFFCILCNSDKFPAPFLNSI